MTSQLFLFLVLSCGAGVVMVLQGLSKHALERRTSRCPYCGREIESGRACDCLLR